MPLLPHNPENELGAILALVADMSEDEMLGLPDLTPDDLSLIGGIVACAASFDVHLRRLIGLMASQGVIAAQPVKGMRTEDLLARGREIATRILDKDKLPGAFRRFDEMDWCFRARNTFAHLLPKRIRDTGAWLLISADERDARYLPEPRQGGGLLYAIVTRSHVEEQLRDYRALETMFVPVASQWMATASRYQPSSGL